MQITFRLKAQEISMSFLKSLKTMFAGQEIEVIVKSVDPQQKEFSEGQKRLLKMIDENLKNAPVISKDIDIRGLIYDAQYPA